MQLPEHSAAVDPVLHHEPRVAFFTLSWIWDVDVTISIPLPAQHQMFVARNIKTCRNTNHSFWSQESF
jgi:hypothetical protein